ncbi:MAG: hypothetical protein LBN23_06920 [Paludibacter sp.]|jgi:primosomal protein N'|nr:hypothetical protein [Paludibacter sp.]
MNLEHLKWLQKLSLEELQTLLQKALPEIKSYENLSEQAAEYRQTARLLKSGGNNKEELAEQKKASKLYVKNYTLSTNLVLPCLGLIIVALFLFIIAPIIALILLIVSIYLLVNLDKKIKKNTLEASNIQLNNALNCEKQAQAVLANAEGLPLLPDGYCYSTAIKEMLNIIEKGRANDWKELADKYDEQYHRWTMEENAAERLELQRQQAEAIDDILKTTRSARNWAAAGALTSLAGAAGVWRK